MLSRKLYVRMAPEGAMNPSMWQWTCWKAILEGKSDPR